jgi:hypothetical protein
MTFPERSDEGEALSACDRRRPDAGLGRQADQRERRIEQQEAGDARLAMTVRPVEVLPRQIDQRRRERQTNAQAAGSPA